MRRNDAATAGPGTPGPWRRRPRRPHLPMIDPTCRPLKVNVTARARSELGTERAMMSVAAEGAVASPKPTMARARQRPAWVVAPQPGAQHKEAHQQRNASPDPTDQQRCRVCAGGVCMA